MALLDNKEQAALDAWAREDEAAAAQFVALMASRYGALEYEELLKRYIKEFPDRWLQLIAWLTATYAATEGDVERAAGRVALGKTGDESAGITQAQLDAAVAAAVAEAREQGRQESTIASQSANSIRALQAAIFNACSNDSRCDIAGFGGASGALAYASDLYARIQGTPLNAPGQARAGYPLVVDLLANARRIDGDYSRAIPSNDTVNLLIELQRRAA